MKTELFTGLRRSLIEELDAAGELTDEEILEKIDLLVLGAGRGNHLSLKEKETLRRDLFCSVRRLDILQELIDDPEVTEIMVNGSRDIFLEKNGKLFRWDKCFASESRLEDVIQIIVGRCNRIVNEQSPIVDARLEDGARVNVILPPVALNGPVLTIRRFPKDVITMQKLIAWGSISAEAAEFLGKLVKSRYSILIGGGTSTGKTTFLNALSSYIPKEERVVTIEDNAELQIQGLEDLVRLESRRKNLEGNKEITMRDLIRTTLRLRPSRIIIGEIRGAEAADFLTCLNTGHTGSLGTAHANSVRDMTGRLETMVLMGMQLPVPVIRRQIAAGIEILVQLARDVNGRRAVREIAEITGMDGDEIRMHTLFARNGKGELRREEELVHWEKLSGICENGL